MQNAIGYSRADEKLNKKLYTYYLENDAFDGWDNQDKYGNFRLLTKITDFTANSLVGSTCLDIGCGTGDFAGFLQKYEISHYVGIDIFKPSIVIAKEKYPHEVFLHGDFLRMSIKQEFHYAFSSGTLATRLQTDNYKLLELLVRKMWQVTTKGAVFNFLMQEYKGQEDSDLFIYDLDKVLTICEIALPEAKIAVKKNRAGDNLEFLQAHIYLYR